MEALAKPDGDINEDFNFWAAVPGNLKEAYLKYSRVFQNRVRTVLSEFRVIPEEEEQPTAVKVKGLITEWKRRTPMGNQKPSDFTLELQFLAPDKKQYLELSADFASISFMPKTRAALENMKSLILLDLKILLGADISWQHGSKQHEAELPAPALPEAGSEDDKSESGAEEAAPAKPRSPAKPKSPAKAKDAAPASAPAAPDPTNILTWEQDTWNDIPFDQIRFPPDMHLHKIKAYYAVAVILLNSPTLRAKHKPVWSELTSAWLNSFGVALTDDTLGMPPAAGPNAFSADELEWCAQALRFFRAGGEARSPSPLEAARRVSVRTKRRAGRSVGGGDGGAAARTPTTTKEAQQFTPSTKSARCVFVIFWAHFSIYHLFELFEEV